MSETETRAIGRQNGWSSGFTETESESEAWVTSYEEFRQLSSVQFRGIPEILFRKMQELHRQPIGQCTVMVRGRRPQPCLVPDMSYAPPTEAARTAFLAKIFERREYVPTEAADRSIEERANALLREAKRGRIREDSEPDLWVDVGASLTPAGRPPSRPG